MSVERAPTRTSESRRVLALAQAQPCLQPRTRRVPIPPSFRLDDGSALPDAHVELNLYGPEDGPLVLVAGGISATRHLCGPNGWWDETVGPASGVDLNIFQVVGFDFAPCGDFRVAMSPGAQARLLELALDALAAERLYAFIGASYGAMVGLALAAQAPKRVERLCVISAAHRPAPMSLAWRGIQRRMVEFGIEQGKPGEGLSLARQLAMTTYRSADEFDQRFNCLLSAGGLCDLDRYLISRGEAYAEAVDAARWLSLSEAIDRTRVAPEAIRAETTLVACPSDRLVPFELMTELAQRLPYLSALHSLPSLYGHDAFLKEPARLNAILRTFLETESQ